VQSALQLGFRDLQDIERELYGAAVIRIEETSPGRWNVYWNGTRHDKGTLIAKDSPTPVRDAEEYLLREHVIFSGDEIHLHTLREAKKRGRPPIGEKPMTNAEHQRKWYWKHRARFDPAATPGRTKTGTDRPPPLGPTVPVALHEDNVNDRSDRMQARRAAKVDSTKRTRKAG
jgi:hypothetical protein